jgi:DNA polymerase-3 subunit epsilon
MPIPKSSTAIHGITDEMVKEAGSFATVGLAFIEFCGPDAVLMAHNNDSFDVLFLQEECKRHGVELPTWPMVDTLKWARKYRSDLPRHSLQFLRQIYGVAENQAHRALDDVMVLHEIFSVMIDDLPIVTVLDLLKAQGVASSSGEVMPFGKHKGVALKDLPKDYVQWLKKQDFLEKNQELKNALAKLETQGAVKAADSPIAVS